MDDINILCDLCGNSLRKWEILPRTHQDPVGASPRLPPQLVATMRLLATMIGSYVKPPEYANDERTPLRFAFVECCIESMEEGESTQSR